MEAKELKPEELRIGNWINERDPRMGKAAKPTQVSYNTFGYWFDADYATWKAEYTPIPLTPVILEAAGFERSVNMTFDFYKMGDIHIKYCKQKFALGWEAGAWYISWLGCSNCLLEKPSIHWVQNWIYFLTGNELEIKLTA